MGLFGSIFSFGKAEVLEEMISQNAKVIDVRSAAEFQAGHLENSINIPLDQLDAKMSKFDKEEPLIFCCASGIRSGSAVLKLKARGYTNIKNGKGWKSLEKYFSQG